MHLAAKPSIASESESVYSPDGRGEEDYGEGKAGESKSESEIIYTYLPHLIVEDKRMTVRVRQVMQTAHRQDTYLTRIRVKPTILII